MVALADEVLRFAQAHGKFLELTERVHAAVVLDHIESLEGLGRIGENAGVFAVDYGNRKLKELRELVAFAERLGVELPDVPTKGDLFTNLRVTEIS